MRRILVFTLIFISHLLYSQTPKQEPYFGFPINPGQQNFLAGSMGELRSSHFHAGIDVKTGGQIGLPVYAAADGYVWRIKVSSSGYGNALYLKHPNGTTTVYAHLDEYNDPIAAHVLKEQYKQESFEIQLFPSEDLFPVKKGDIIAYSGNTGSSSGPHLHFEIRDKSQRILDPLTFGFEEIKDNIPPWLKNIAFVTLDKDARVNETFGRYDFEVIKTQGGYFSTRTPIKLDGKIGIEIYAYDRQDGVWSKNGISQITLKIDGDTIFHQHKERLSFSKQRNILTHMDYAAYKEKWIKYNKLFVDDGNTNDFYLKPSKGFVFDDSVHTIQIYLRDTHGNISSFETQVNNHKIVNKPDPKIDKFEVFRNYLHFKADHVDQAHLLQLYFGQAYVELLPYRTDKRAAYYIWDLREGQPDSVNFCGEVMKTGIFAEIPSHEEVAFYNHDIDVLFPQRSLFDTLYLRFEKDYDSIKNLELFHFPHHDVPLKNYVTVTLKPKKSYPDSTTAVFSVFGHTLNYVGGTWKEDVIQFRTRDLVTYTLAQDTIPPMISPVIINKDQLYFKINDEHSGIKEYRATVNGQFVLMKYEPKKRLIWSEKLEPNIPFKGELVLEVTDLLGNKEIYQTTLN